MWGARRAPENLYTLLKPKSQGVWKTEEQIYYNEINTFSWELGIGFNSIKVSKVFNPINNEKVIIKLWVQV